MISSDVSEVSNGPISVLLVDDDEDWGLLLARTIERETDDIHVSVALDANEAMVMVQERDSFDCLLVDYKMPGVSGLELLDRVRTNYPRLPFILVTSEGNEAVASRAMDAGVTDYIVKDPIDTQTGRYVSAIREAVEQYRLREMIEENEERYRSVVEASHDGIAVIRRGEVLFCNERLADLTGRSCEALREADFIDLAVHPNDQETVTDIREDWLIGETQGTLHEIRIVRPDGEVRHCEFTGRQLTYQGRDALAVSFRDVTERRRQETELRWERELNRTVQDALVDSRTREALEAAIVEQLHEYGFEYVWIAERDGQVLVPRVVAGESESVERIVASVSDEGTNSEPVAWAARTGEVQIVQNFADLFATEWQEVAIETGFRAGAGFPLQYRGVTYGVLGVYTTESEGFDEADRRLLTELADTVAFAIHSLETENALATEQPVAVQVVIEDESYYLVDLAREGAFMGSEQVRVRGTIPHGEEEIIQFLRVAGVSIDTVRSGLEAHPDVTNVVTIDEGDPFCLQVTVDGLVPEAHLASRGIIVDSTVIDADAATVKIVLSDRDSVSSTVESLKSVFDPVSVLSISEQERDTEEFLEAFPRAEELTDKQAEALQAAYHHGYFQQPRGNTASAIADSLGVSHSTFLQHLHRAQEKLYDRLFDR